jgi:G protein-coupled receptor 83
MEILLVPTDNSSAFNLQDLMKIMEDMDVGMSEERKNLILIVTYSLIVIVSLIGNILVCKVILERRSSLSTTNVLIANLAISDLLMTTINIPFNIARFVIPSWPFGQVLCVLVPFIQSVSVHCSSLTMMFIAIERYKSLLLNTHINGHCFRGNCFPFAGILLLIWLLSALFSIPHGVYNQVVGVSEWNEIVRCRVVYPEPKDVFKQRFTIISLLTQYVVPIVLTLVCYVRISLFLWRREIVGQLTECHRISIIRRKKRRIKMLITVVLVFAICWLPLNLFLLITSFDPQFFNSSAFFICHWFAMSSVW